MTDVHTAKKTLAAGVALTTIAVVATTLPRVPADVTAIGPPGLTMPPAGIGVAMVVFGLIGMGVVIGGALR